MSPDLPSAPASVAQAIGVWAPVRGYPSDMTHTPDEQQGPPPETGHGTGHDVPREVSEEAADSRGTEWIDNLGRSQFGAPDQPEDRTPPS